MTCNHNWNGPFPRCRYCACTPVECPVCERPLHGKGICIDGNKAHVVKELIVVAEGNLDTPIQQVEADD